MEKTNGKYFFALKIKAPWPTSWPDGRLIEERHCTLAFLGDSPIEDVEKTLKFPSQIGMCGLFSRCITLPPHRKNVVAWKIDWFDEAVIAYQKKLVHWLKEQKIPLEERKWLPHTSLCRRPFDEKAWFESFTPLPCYAESLHFYESLGHSQYRSLWSTGFMAPFEEIEHMADLAFRIYGKDLFGIYFAAFTALAFRFPSLTPYFRENVIMKGLEDCIILLNEIVHELDTAAGCPFKAVSFHGELQEIEKGLFEWEMIVDV